MKIGSRVFPLSPQAKRGCLVVLPVFVGVLLTLVVYGAGSQLANNVGIGNKAFGEITHEVSGNTATLPPGASLPDEKTCASRVQRSAFEPRSENSIPNHHVPSPSEIAGLTPWGPQAGFSPAADGLRKQITGNFVGTTDEILAWAACKWGVDADIVRAEAVTESDWRQSRVGDYTADPSLCPPKMWESVGCYQSYGILQIKYVYNKSAWPMSRDDTAFSAEYTYGVIRACYEGWTTYLYNIPPLKGYPAYHAGDIWGCLGVWYSGRWYSQDALNYISAVKMHLARRDWRQNTF